MHPQRLTQGEGLLTPQVRVQVYRRSLLEQLVLVMPLVLDHGDSGRWMLSERVVLQERPEEVVLVLRRLGQIDRPGHDLSVLEDVVGVLVTVCLEHESGHATRGCTRIPRGVLRTCRRRRALGLADDRRALRPRGRDAYRRREADAQRGKRQQGGKATCRASVACSPVAHRCRNTATLSSVAASATPPSPGMEPHSL